MPVKKAKKTVTEPQQKKAQVKVNGLPLDKGVAKEFDKALNEFRKQAKRKAFLGNVLMYTPFVALMLLIFVTLSGWLIGVLTTIASIIVGQLIGKFMNWATGMAVKGEMQLDRINRIAGNKNDIVNMLVKDLGEDLTKIKKLHRK